MQKTISITTLVFSMLVLLLVCTTATASVFGVYSDDAQAAALGGAFIARTSGASSVFYNPAALVNSKGFSLAGKFHTQNNDFSLAGQANEADRLSNFSGSISYSLTDWLTVGGGFSSFLQDSVEINDLSELPIFDLFSEFGVNLFRGVAALKVTDNLSVGFSLDYYDAEINTNTTFKLNTPFFYSMGVEPSAADQQYNISGNGFGFSVGVLAQVNEDFSFGATFRGEADLEMEGTLQYPSPFGDASQVIWSDPTGAFDPRVPYEQQFPSRLPVDATATFTVPADLGLGLYYDFGNKLSASADVHWVQWSSLADKSITTETSEIPLAGEFDDTFSLHLGAKYKLTSLVSLLGGFANIPSPGSDDAASILSPYGDQRDFSVGIAFESITYMTGTEEQTGNYGGYLTMVFSQLDGLDPMSTSSFAPTLSAPFTNYPFTDGTAAGGSSNIFTFLVGFKLDVN